VLIVIATISKRTNKSGTYYYLVESARVNGKPRIVKQVYLGTAERIEKAVGLMSSDSKLQDPNIVTVHEFCAVTALYSVADRLGIRQIIDEIAEKRNQGLSVASSILLAAINRAIAPTSKNTFYEWFDKTVLYKIFPQANAKNLSSQGFWNNMEALDEDKIRRIEDEITKRVVEQYSIDTECLLFDNTNFFTYIDTDNNSVLAKRGHSKEKRTDLKIIGLSLMVSPDHNIPLFHEAYPGNKNDALQFNDIITKIKERYNKLDRGDCTLTLVFDKGNNNGDNINSILETKQSVFHFVGGLRLNQCPELLDISKSKFVQLGGPFRETIAYRTEKHVYGRDLTVVVTFNPELYKAQVDGILANIASCEKALSALNEKLCARRAEVVTKGKNPTIESVEKNIKGILSAEHMQDVFSYAVDGDPGQTPYMAFSFKEDNWDALREHILGKSILFTDRSDWTTGQIVGAYRSQYHVEEAFKQMKDIKYLSFKPIRHFTDAHIRVHAFYCVLSYMLASLLNKELDCMGYKLSIHRMLDLFQNAQLVKSVFIQSEGKPVIKTSYSRFEGITKEYAEKYKLLKYLS
jgi:transposase